MNKWAELHSPPLHDNNQIPSEVESVGQGPQGARVDALVANKQKFQTSGTHEHTCSLHKRHLMM